MAHAEGISDEAQGLIDRFQLQAHPEGGFYARTYTSAAKVPGSVLSSRHGGDRETSTMIYFLLPKGHVSHLHRIASDESWHHYAGDPLLVLECNDVQGGSVVSATALGPPSACVQGVSSGSPSVAAQPSDGQEVVHCTPQHVVPGGRWFGACLPEGASYAFVGCCVAPGFHFDDFELATGAAVQDSILATVRGTDGGSGKGLECVGPAGAACVPLQSDIGAAIIQGIFPHQQDK